MILRKAERAVFNKFLALIAIGVWVILPSSHVWAVSGDGLIAYPTTADPNNSLSQSWFIYSLNKGESKEDYLTIKNESDQAQSVSIYAVDSTTNNMGEFALENETDTRDNVGKWISAETSHLVLAANETKQVKFNISIPDDAPTGETSGGIIIQKDLTTAQKNTKSGFVINTRIGIRVYETVPGETVRKASFSRSSVEYNKKDAKYTYNVTIKNDGNISLDSTVIVKIKDMLFGKQDQTIEQKINIPRGEELTVAVPLENVKIGQFEASSVLTYKNSDGSDETVTNPDKSSFSAFPQEYIPVIGLLLLVNLLFILILKLKKRRDKKRYKDYEVQAGDNLENIADRLEMSWKKIAKINKLKAPYQLEIGQTIKIIDKNDVFSSLSPKSEVLAEPTERVRQDRKEAFEKDLALISDKESSSSSDGEESHTGKKMVKILLLLIILSTLGYFAYTEIIAKGNNANFVYDRGGSKPTSTNEEQASETPNDGTGVVTEGNKPTGITIPDSVAAKEPAAEVISAADRQAVKIEILNGSGVKGASTKASASFKEKGYTAVTTGNADRFDYTSTLIQCGSNVKSTVCQEAKDIVAALPYSSIEDKESTGANTDKIIVTLGK